MNEILKTKNYEQFIMLDINRHEIKESNIKKMVEAIKERNLLSKRPILVNSKMEVIDGQHRLLAAQRLGLDIYYVIDREIKVDDIGILNSHQKNWSLEDYHNYYYKMDYPEYVKLQRFMEKYDLSLQMALTYGGHYKRGGMQEIFRTAKFKFDTSYADSFCKTMMDVINHIQEQIGKPQFLRTTRFVKSLGQFLKLPGVDIELFKHKITLQSFLIKLKPDYAGYITMFCEIYNYRNMNKVELA